MEFVVLALVGIVVLGPERLPQFARDAARMIRTLRDLATGARQQLREELGPEFADLDLANLNPRTAVQRAVFGDELPDLRKYSPSAMVRNAIFADEDDAGAEADSPISMTKPSANGHSASSANGSSSGPVNGSSSRGPVNGSSSRGPAGGSSNGSSSASPRADRPRPRPRPRTHYDEDAT
jgi:sec-independent protein translocase protein TatB